jgi:hypothetical protein
VLEGGTTNGGAVLRIADQYIPVLFGTTLVSRIAVPRDATNLFILARGANCDNAIAHVTVEASTFTKIRDPSGVFSSPFTLSPSCVTASGTILMPAYTITPDVVCFHCPTSKVCRITSADPDIYFVTTLGYVREYTPTAPEIQTNSFDIGSVPIQLACMDAALSTRASVTNIPAHLCNPDTGFDDEYPDGEKYSLWCKFQDGVHVYADGYGPTNCPCLDFTNAYECLCSGDGRKPCTCAHGVSDPKAMPLNADQTNVLGHAALVIGGDNDLLQVAVPEGTYRPCLLCGCASGEPSSADVYRQTSCIEVTPGTLTADGAFSVAGMHPSTNFADTVFMYSITDYSAAQKATRYTRKDYTVLGTSVYPTDPGHSVSNWFIGCNVTNVLTLWTGVGLPSDTGDVTLSVSIESGTPMPRLYVYNRLAQSNELFVAQGEFVYMQNLGEWRENYCDTNGNVQAYLICASGGVARVTHSFSTYSGQPYSVTCSAEQLVSSFIVQSIDVTSIKEGTSSNPPPFEGNRPWVFCVTNSLVPDKHFVVFYKDVVTTNTFEVQDFDITIAASISPNQACTGHVGMAWSKLSGPNSGTLNNTDRPEILYRNVKSGGVYRVAFDFGQNERRQRSEANILLPLAGAEMDEVIKADLVRANAFAQIVTNKYSALQRNLSSNGERWFVTRNAGDYTGRPDNVVTPTVWHYNQVNTTPSSDNYGLGVVCTWKKRPVRLSKLSNFMVFYSCRKIGVSMTRAWLARVYYGTLDSASATLSWNASQSVADGADYDATVSSLVNNIWIQEASTDKSKKLWPNSSPPDNFVEPYYSLDLDREFTSPRFLYMTNP